MSSSQKKDSTRYVLSCDVRKCTQHISSVLGQERTLELANERGWWFATKNVRPRKSRPALCPIHNNTDKVTDRQAAGTKVKKGKR